MWVSVAPVHCQNGHKNASGQDETLPNFFALFPCPPLWNMTMHEITTIQVLKTQAKCSNSQSSDGDKNVLRVMSTFFVQRKTPSRNPKNWFSLTAKVPKT